jgi:hypothetical protein
VSQLQPYTLLAQRRVMLKSGVVPAGGLLRTWSLSLACGLARRGLAEPNDVYTAESVELCLRLWRLARAAEVLNPSSASERAHG